MRYSLAEEEAALPQPAQLCSGDLCTDIIVLLLILIYLNVCSLSISVLSITDLPSPQSPRTVFFCSITWENNIYLEKVSVTVADSAALNIMSSLAGDLK